jgi:hypothetical protein
MTAEKLKYLEFEMDVVWVKNGRVNALQKFRQTTYTPLQGDAKRISFRDSP